MFETYLKLGFDHILDPNAYDHILFVVSFSLLASLSSWKKLFWLVTAFTIGHSMTLAMSVLDVIKIPSNIVEFLIPITIILSCADNIFQANKDLSFSPRYILILIFGFIHGMGFSNFFKAILGKEESILVHLFSFNIGVELAQLCIVFLSVLIIQLLKKIISETYLIVASSVIIGLVALSLLF